MCEKNTKINCDGLEYTVENEYLPNWKASISLVDGYSFLIMNEDDKTYISHSSKVSYSAAESVVYRGYLAALSCDHEWIRWMPHARYGVCTKCKLIDKEKFDSPYSCQHEGCNKLGDFSAPKENERNAHENLCLEHFIDSLNILYKKLKSNISIDKNNNNKECNEDHDEDEDEYEEDDNLDYHYSLIFQLKVIEKLKDTDFFINKTNSEKIVFIESLSYDYYETIKRTAFDAMSAVNITSIKVIEMYSYHNKITLEDIDWLVSKYLLQEQLIIDPNFDQFKLVHKLKASLRK